MEHLLADHSEGALKSVVQSIVRRSAITTGCKPMAGVITGDYFKPPLFGAGVRTRCTLPFPVFCTADIDQPRINDNAVHRRPWAWNKISEYLANHAVDGKRPRHTLSLVPEIPSLMCSITKPLPHAGGWARASVVPGRRPASRRRFWQAALARFVLLPLCLARPHRKQSYYSKLKPSPRAKVSKRRHALLGTARGRQDLGSGLGNRAEHGRAREGVKG